MRLIDSYTPPTPDDLAKLKNDLSFTGNEMAYLAGISSNSQWRKYTCGENPRAVSAHILFFIAAQLELNSDEMDRVLKKMQNIGADFKSN